MTCPQTTVAHAIVEALADAVPAPDGRPARVAIDGMTGVGKTTLRSDLAAVLRARGRVVIEASGDDFHRPRSERYRQGRRSARGYYEDAYDYEALADKLLRPLGPDGNRRVRLRHHDLATDAILDDERCVELGSDVTLVVDGNFLQRRELDGLWDRVVFVEASREVSAARQAERDGAPENPDDPYHSRYFGGYEVYVAERDPRSRANVVVVNES